MLTKARAKIKKNCLRCVLKKKKIHYINFVLLAENETGRSVALGGRVDQGREPAGEGRT